MTRSPLVASPGLHRIVRLAPRSAASRGMARSGPHDGEEADRTGSQIEPQAVVTPFVERRRGVRGALTGVLSVTRCAWRVVDLRR